MAGRAAGGKRAGAGATRSGRRTRSSKSLPELPPLSRARSQSPGGRSGRAGKGFRDRTRREPTADYDQVPPIRPRPPVTPEALAAAEAKLGFPLPPLLRALYTQIGDGGYGPGRGLDHLDGDELSLVATAERTCV